MFPFHYAFKVKDIPSTVSFYHDLLGCKIGRQTDAFMDFDFFGHQLSAHIGKNDDELDFSGMAEDIKVPMNHFGIVLDVATFTTLQAKLENSTVEFIIKPCLRFANKPGSQYTMFVLDYSNNPVEFKAHLDTDGLFATT